MTLRGDEFWLAAMKLFALDRRILRNMVASLAESRDHITAALDILSIGFEF